ncbi:hypothetical protein AGMMS50284_4460 [Clostridia bacterium]|nr:hypothetical protein AGMMS50284_4460 [Clostridia bacterium]
MTIGERIKQIRQALSLTQTKFAERIGISTSYVAEIEIGNKTANDRTMRLISTEFQVDEHWLRTGEGEMYHEAAAANIAQITSLFKSMSPGFQQCALTQLNALAELYNQSKT